MPVGDACWWHTSVISSTPSTNERTTELLLRPSAKRCITGSCCALTIMSTRSASLRNERATMSYGERRVRFEARVQHMVFDEDCFCFECSQRTICTCQLRTAAQLPSLTTQYTDNQQAVHS